MGQIYKRYTTPSFPTALIVRFLTKRYIGEYDHQTENRYKHEAMVDGEPVLFEILDTCPKVEYNYSLTYGLPFSHITFQFLLRPTTSIQMLPS